MTTRKLKVPDPSRSNTLPRYITEENTPSQEKDAKKFLSSSLNRVDRDDIKRLLKSTDDGQTTNSAIQRIEEKKRLELQKRKAHESAIYSLDLGPLDTFNLPGRPEARSTLPPEMTKKSRTRPSHSKSSASQQPVEAEPEETGKFLPTLLGIYQSMTSL